MQKHNTACLLCLKTKNLLISKDKTKLAHIWNWVLKITSILENAIMCIESAWGCKSLRDRATWHGCLQVPQAFFSWIPFTSQKLFSIIDVTSSGHFQFVKLKISSSFQFLFSWYSKDGSCISVLSRTVSWITAFCTVAILTLNSSEIIKFFSWAQAIYVLCIEVLRID